MRISRFRYCAAVLAAAVLVVVEPRYTRPSDHGLAYQTEPKVQSSPQMAAFFAGSSSSEVALPKALNSSQPAWYRGRGGGGGGGGGDGGSREGRGNHHVRKVLLVASLVCGITGVALLVVVAFLFVGQYRRHKQSSSPSPSPSDK